MWAGCGPGADPMNSDERMQSEIEHEEYDGGERYCWDCGGRGWKITCPDDLCHGQECIHGDPPMRCWMCNRDGELEDSYL